MLEEKLDILTKEIVALRKAVEANTAAGGATASADSADAAPAKAPAKRGRPAKEVVEPEHDAAEVEAIVRKVSKEIGRPAAVKIIKGLKCEDLADLLTKPDTFDAAFEQATAALEAAAPEEEEDDEI